MLELDSASDLKEFFRQVRVSGRSVNIGFIGLEKNSVEGVIAKVGADFVEIRHQYSQFICPYNAIRLVTIRG